MSALVYLADESSDAATLGGGVGVVIFLIAAVSYVLFCWPLAKVFAKAGVTPGSAWVPILNYWKLFNLGGIPGFLSIVPFVAGIAWLFAVINVTKRFNQPGGVALIGWIAPWLWAFMIGFGDSVWVGQRDPQGYAMGAQQGAPGNRQQQYEQPQYGQQQFGQQQFGQQQQFAQPAQSGYGQQYDGQQQSPQQMTVPQPMAQPNFGQVPPALGAPAMGENFAGQSGYNFEQPDTDDSGPKSLTELGEAVGAEPILDGGSQSASDGYWGQVAGSGATGADSDYAQFAPSIPSVPSAPAAPLIPQVPQAPQVSQFEPPAVQPPATADVVSTDAPAAAFGYDIPLVPAAPSEQVVPESPVAEPSVSPTVNSAFAPPVPPAGSVGGAVPMSASVPSAVSTGSAGNASGVNDASGTDAAAEDEGETVIVRRAPVAQWQIEAATGSIIPLSGTQFLLGRKPVASATYPQAAVIAIHDPEKTVSKVHAFLEYNEQDEVWTITDLNSTNGVFVGEQVLEVPAGGSAQLTDSFMLGELSLRLTKLEG